MSAWNYAPARGRAAQPSPGDSPSPPRISRSNTLLISNNTNTGTINGFNLTTGAFVETIVNGLGKPFIFNQVWGIEFGGGTAANGNTNQLFFTAGPKNNLNGVFGVISFK